MSNAESNFIMPTIGRRVWFWPPADETHQFEVIDPSQPLDAGIVHVHGSRLVNLDVTDHVGAHYGITSVTLVQPGDIRPIGVWFCEWMPFQKGQAPQKADAIPPGTVVRLKSGGPDMVVVQGDQVAWPSPGGHSIQRDHFPPEALEVVSPTSTPVPPRAVADVVSEEQIASASIGPRVTPAEIEAAIASENYFTAMDGVRTHHPVRVGDEVPLSLLTFCVLVLRNGFTVYGASACASPENFNAEIGKRIAREDAVNKMWPLLGYELRSKLAAA